MNKKFLLIFFLNQVLFANNCYNIRTNKDLPKLIIKNIKNIINREQSKIEYSYEKELIMKGIIKKAIQPFGYINPSISLKMPKQSCGRQSTPPKRVRRITILCSGCHWPQNGKPNITAPMHLMH